MALKLIFSNIMILLFGLTSCVQPPAPLQDSSAKSAREAVYIVCEGIWGLNNSSLSRIDAITGDLDLDIFAQSNGFSLGDLSNDLAIHGDTGLIAVSSSRTVERINLLNAKSLGRLQFNSKGEVRKICIINDSIAYVTRQLGNFISKINFKTMKILQDSITVGIAPEGIASYGNKLFVANSGYGDYLKHLDGASTISIVSIIDNEEMLKIGTGVNPLEIIVSERNQRFYVAYANLPSLRELYDSTGGIIEYDALSLKMLRHWKCNPRSPVLNSAQDTILLINNRNIAAIDLKTGELIDKYIKNPSHTDFWYSVSISENGDFIWIGNAKDYSGTSEVIQYKKSDFKQAFRYYKSGINPSKILNFRSQ